jgi:glycosyltransferase involved in cell wall biosynthesis
MVVRHAFLAGRVTALGSLDAAAAAASIAGCDVLVQPYPGGINARRGSAMAALGLGRAVVTNAGDWSEPIWHTSGAVELASSARLGAACRLLLNDPNRRQDLGRRAAFLYQTRFALEHTIRTVRDVGAALPAAAG